MKELMTNKNLMYAGIGLLTAIIIYKVIVKRDKADETIIVKGKPVEITKDNKSSFCGCGA
jgi:hypothetical protein